MRLRPIDGLHYTPLPLCLSNGIVAPCRTLLAVMEQLGSTIPIMKMRSMRFSSAPMQMHLSIGQYVISLMILLHISKDGHDHFRVWAWSETPPCVVLLVRASYRGRLSGLALQLCEIRFDRSTAKYKAIMYRRFVLLCLVSVGN